jgi:hypothetical protein
MGTRNDKSAVPGWPGDPMTETHRRSWWRPWLCTCGRRWYCGAYDVARTEAGRTHARHAVDWYAAYFATRPPAASQFTSPTTPVRPTVGRASVPPPHRVLRPHVHVRPHANQGRFR